MLGRLLKTSFNSQIHHSRVQLSMVTENPVVQYCFSLVHGGAENDLFAFEPILC
jgi:hypothetical protein